MILLVAKSGSGKDYITKAFNLKMVVSNTTRPPREGEVDGVDKNFYNFNLVPDDIKIAKTYINGYDYWVTKRDLEGKDCFIVDMNGVICIKEIYHFLFYDKFQVIYLHCAWYKRLYRLIKRDGLVKAIKRFVHDIKAFEDIEKVKHVRINV
jgi:guanylate kinase